MNARLDEIEARAAAATKGPWEPSHERETDTRPAWAYDVHDNDGDTLIGSGLYLDTVFIAAARQDVPALVAALRAVLRVCDDADRVALLHNPRTVDHRPCESMARKVFSDRQRAAITAALDAS